MARTVTLRITTGKPFPEWCDRCLVTHMWVRIYHADRPAAPPLGTAGMHERAWRFCARPREEKA